ncbi:cobalamin biosynthesis protein CobW [Pseudomonas cavernae]|uniref:Cobalamin biosynthesis protein CobW n=1 Tax=Pseudomonas cavernae TaxID=2320867 RepID=A0A385Z9N9_9PSED|nr:CobW-like GTP-binding protein [Pseudomonas cavernae]AYC34953.1 cobalamin biosynthesis protein CobW [Pseudomonas cavernae]
MLKHIPTHLIAGPLGAGKTSLIRQLLAQKPAHERWAVLINEFGQIGLDAALLSTAADGIALGEVAGGCLCCVNGAPFQVGLGRLLRQARPDRLLIEPSGLGHPAELLRQLREPPWAQVLAVQPPVLVLDAAALAGGQALPASQQAALAEAGLLLLNKAEHLDAATRARLAAGLPDLPLRWTSQGRLPFSALPGHAAQAGQAADTPLPNGTAPLPALWRDPGEPICQIQAQAEGWSIGWRWHPSQRFELLRVQQWLATLPWRRAKLVLHCNPGWLSANALDGEPIHWRNSEWRKDSRLELIFAEAQDAAALQAGMLACRLDP